MSMKFLKDLIKKAFVYFILFTGLVLSSMIFDSIINTSDDRGYQKEVYVVFLLEYLIPRMRS